jgi:hypothetical protein
VDAKAKRLTLIACILGTVVVFVDGTIVNVALPKIRSDLGVGLSAQQWIIDSYLLTLGSLLLVGGSLGDLYGPQWRCSGSGVIGFGITSLLCAAAPTATLLILARGAAGRERARCLVPATLGIITATFSDAERGKAIGTWTAWSGISTVIGPLAAGPDPRERVLALHLRRQHRADPHHAVPDPPHVGGPRPSARGLGRRGRGGAVRARAGRRRVRADRAAQLLVGRSDHLGTARSAGWPCSSRSLLWERRAPDPMLSLDLFRRPELLGRQRLDPARLRRLGGSTFLLPIFLQEVAGYTPLAAGTALLPVTIIMFLLSSRFGALADRFGPRWFMGLGPIVAAVGLLLFMQLGADVTWVTDVLPAVDRLRARADDDRCAADRDRARWCRRGACEPGLGHQQRHRPRGRTRGDCLRGRGGCRPSSRRRWTTASSPTLRLRACPPRCTRPRTAPMAATAPGERGDRIRHSCAPP